MQDRRADSRGQHNLPLLAPRYETGPSGSQSASSGASNPPPERRRNRLPPRSRSGCWTCRTRKVKCDEQRPACGQCLRLGHTCDYNPRVAFKDDTPRIVERMQEVSIKGSSIWDPNAPDPDSFQDYSATEDDLPPFSILTTDEQRERKAELQDPGTYHVIANPDSFLSLPEYRDESISGRSNDILGSTGEVDDSYDSRNSPSGPVAVSDDPNIVILKVFEEASHRGSSQLPSKHSTHEPSPGSSNFSLSTPRPSTPPQLFPIDEQNIPVVDSADSEERSAVLLQHYRSTISPHIGCGERLESGEDLLEVSARSYIPLFHAIMALAALSMAHQNGIHNADALEHYQKAIPALKTAIRSSQDSYSDGVFFTHFVLLLYEIAAAGHRESNMWQHHSDRLLRIITLRRQTSREETYDCIVWMICCIDIYALLSTSGTGAFVEDLIKQRMLPIPERCLAPILPSQGPLFYQEELAYFPELLNLNHKVLLVAFQVGQLARNLRAEAIQRQHGVADQMTSDTIYLMNRNTRIDNLHRLLRHSRDTWRAEIPELLSWIGGPLPRRVFAWVNHSYVLFRACMIYSYTSMFSGQLKERLAASNVEISMCATEIIQAAQEIILQERYELRFIVFPLFMAGFATKDQNEKELALNMIKTIGRHSHGGSTESVRGLLEIIYEKQRTAVLRTGDASSVDWVEEMDLSGQHPIIYGI